MTPAQTPSHRQQAGIAQSPPEAKQRPGRGRRKPGTARSNHTELATMGHDSKRRIHVGRPDGPAERAADTASRADSGTALNPATMSLPASRQNLASAPALIRSVLSTPGMPLSSRARQRFGDDSNANAIRVHTGGLASRSADSLGAHAYASGNHIVFGNGRYAPGTPSGHALLAHELAHVDQNAQEGAHREPVVRGLFGEIASTIGSAFSAVGSAISGAAHTVAGAVSTAVDWIGERLEDASAWLVNLVRDLPERLARLAVTLAEGLAGVVTFIPEAIQALASGGISGFADWLWLRAQRGGAWVLTLLSRVFDMFGGPEMVEFLWRIMTNARRLRTAERAAGQSVLGANAIRWDDVRVSQGGLLDLVFRFNNARAFVMFHTVNFPPNESIDVIVHELTHVYQYETAGSLYLGQAIHAQMTEGYNYGGVAGLQAAQAAGRGFDSFNREQQGQIAQDYYQQVLQAGLPPSDPTALVYQPFIDDLRAGRL